MTTKPASSVQEYPADSIEKKVYSLAEKIPTLEPNDQLRLGYCLWAWLIERKGTLRQAIHAAGVRTSLSEEELTVTIEQELKQAGLLS